MKLTSRPSRGMLLVALAWLVTMLVVFWLLTMVRHRVIASLSNPQARAQWERWREEAAAQQADPNAIVRRRAPKSPEPPALVLMRDNFPAIVVAMLTVVTLCYAFAVMSLRGLFRRC